MPSTELDFIDRLPFALRLWFSGRTLLDPVGLKSMLAEARGIGYPAHPPLSAKQSLLPDREWFRARIEAFVAGDRRNSLVEPLSGPIFDRPLVGFARGDDPIFERLKQAVGPFHLTPSEALGALARRQGRKAPRPAETAVVSWVLPISEASRRAQRERRDQASRHFAQVRLYGELFNQALEWTLVSELAAGGVAAAAPDMTADFKKFKSKESGWASPWSHRHLAYAAGLGTFGLSDGLITPAGKANRCGSIAVGLPLESDRERPENIHHWCLYYRKGGCLHCAKRCPAGAISEAGHDKDKCFKYVFTSFPYHNRHYGVNIYACALCYSRVPCEDRIPFGL